MKNAWPSDTWPAIPVSTFRPSAPMAKMKASVTTRIQSLSPRNRMIGIWLMTGSENGIRNNTAMANAAATFLVAVGSICASAS